jgi:hypothetical protein
MIKGMAATGVAVWAGIGLAVLAGCAGRNLNSSPEVDSFTATTLATVNGATEQVAPVGSSVVIYGHHFKSVSAVSFAGQPAAGFSVDGDTQITATVPDSAISGAITVENPDGLGTSPTSLLIQPAITAISPTTGPAGTVVVLTGSGFYSASLYAVTFGTETAGATATTCTYIDPNHLTAVVGSDVAPGAVTVSVTVSGLPAVAGPTFTVTN